MLLTTNDLGVCFSVVNSAVGFVVGVETKRYNLDVLSWKRSSKSTFNL